MDDDPWGKQRLVCELLAWPKGKKEGAEPFPSAASPNPGGSPGAPHRSHLQVLWKRTSQLHRLLVKTRPGRAGHYLSSHKPSWRPPKSSRAWV